MGRPGLTCLRTGQLYKCDETVPWYYDPLWAYLVPAPATDGRRIRGTITDGTKTEVLGETKNLSQCHLVNKSQVEYHGNKFLHR